MAGDWAKRYVEAQNREQAEQRQKEQDDRERRRLAEKGASEKFHQIQERIRQDIKTLGGAVAFQAVEFQENSEGNFTVLYRGPLRVELEVTLDANRIRCSYAVFPKGGAKDPKREINTLRICSDLDGFLTVYGNGAGDSFDDDSEVSEFILRPLLTHIISQ